MLIPFQAFSFYLKDQFKDAKTGDYIVIEQERQMTLMLIHSKTDATLFLEEITIPEKLVNDRFSWANWIKKKAPKNTSWILYEIALNSGKILEEYSFSRHCWIDPTIAENFLPTLLNLNFMKMPEDERRRAGRAPEKGEKDKRPLWQPNLIVNGKIIPGATFNSYKARWPKDSSQLSDSLIEIYLPTNSQLAPSYFPYWLQVSDRFAKANIRIIDSGTGLISPNPGMPRH